MPNFESIPAENVLYGVVLIDPGSKRRPIVALLLRNMATGGTERVRLTLAKAFLSHGFDVHFVLTRAEGGLISNIPAEVRVFDLAAQRLHESIRPLTRYLIEVKPDFTIAAAWPLTSYAVLAHLLARRPGKLIVSDHTSMSRSTANKGVLFRIMLRVSLALTYRFAQARVAVSTGVACDSAALAWLPSNKFVVIYNPFVPRSCEYKIESTSRIDNTFQILSVGNLKPAKNQALLIKAFANVRKTHNAYLTIVGEGPLRPYLEKMIADLSLGDYINLCGFHEDLSYFYRRSDLFVLSSDYEGWPNVLIEALYAGLPIVSTNCVSGPSEILNQGQYGRLVPCGNVPELAAGIVKSLETRSDPKPLRERALIFSAVNGTKAYLDLLSPIY